MKKKLLLKQFYCFLSVLTLFSILIVNPISARGNSMMQKNVSIKMESSSITSILLELQKLSSINFAYNANELKDVKSISVNEKEKSVEYVLNKILQNTGLTYEITGNNVVIKKAEKTTTQSQQPQKRVIVKGKVIDGDTKKPIAGATILVMKSTAGAISDDKGEFSLQVTIGQEIEVSYIGMKNQNRVVTESLPNLTIVMEKDALTVEEVVVNGYQEIKKTRMTGSAETVTSKDIANKGYTSVADILKGSMAGVTTMSISGRPGAESQIRIRGINSLTGSSDPMWIVDGMPLQGDLPTISMGGTEFQETVLTSGIGNIPPDDIESITVLKDAAATAIYGARAANGVIVVKTKRGTEGKAYIGIQTSYAITEAPNNRLQMMNTRQKIDFERGIYEDFPGLHLGGRVQQILREADRGVYTKAQAESMIAELGNTNTDWFKEIFKTGQEQNHSVTLSGGNKETQYYSNLSYMSSLGIIPNNRYESMGANLKLTHDFNRWFRVNFDVRTSLRNDRSSSSTVNPLDYATYANPYEKLYEADGSYAYDRSYYPDLSTVRDGYMYDFNLLKDMEENTSRTKYISNQINLKLEFTILKGLMFSTMGTFSNSNNHTMNELIPGSFSSKVNSWMNRFYSQSEVPDDLNNGRLSESTARSEGWTVRNQFEYARGFSEEDHYLNILLGQEISSSKSYGFESMIPEWDPMYGVANYPDLSGFTMKENSLGDFGSHSESQDRSVSFFLTSSYSYKDRYVVSGSIRFDGADIIGTANRFQPLWDISGKWNIHKEKFMENVKFINQLAIRGSYGFTGSIDRNALPFSLARLTTNQKYMYDGERVFNVYNPSNPSIKWQKAEDKSLGLDLSALNNRVNFVVNYYNKDTRNLLDTKKISSSTGRKSTKANVASLNNRGWELSLKTLNVNTKDFSWTTGFNFSYNKNTVTDTNYESLSDVPLLNSTNEGMYSLYIKGQSVASYYGYEFAGVNPYDGSTLAYVDGYNEKGERYGVLNSEGRYVFSMDKDGSEDLKRAARKYIGESYPPYTGGFNTQFNYKRFSLSTSFTFMTGHLARSFQYYTGDPVSASAKNVPVGEVNRWRKMGDITTIPKYTSSASESAYLYELFDFRYEDCSYLKCNNISLGYNFSPEVCAKLKLTRMRLNFNMGNVFTISKFRGMDPETKGALTYPSARKYNVSLSIGI